jgi:hypothetical protein
MTVAREVNRMAGSHAVWLAWAPSTYGLKSACLDLRLDLGTLRGQPNVAVSPNASVESTWVDRFAPRSPGH